MSLTLPTDGGLFPPRPERRPAQPLDLQSYLMRECPPKRVGEPADGGRNEEPGDRDSNPPPRYFGPCGDSDAGIAGYGAVGHFRFGLSTFGRKERTARARRRAHHEAERHV